MGIIDIYEEMIYMKNGIFWFYYKRTHEYLINIERKWIIQKEKILKWILLKSIIIHYLELLIFISISNIYKSF